ncbi:MAG TPA: GAF domain-containing protein [Candidatus Eisenbacteria bacterium]|jgi:GAF domain-containing protein
MSKFNLRDVSERLSKSDDIDTVVLEFLRFLEASQPDWRASLAFYEVSADALVDVYERDRGRLMRRSIVVPIAQLPHRLVRKLFHASAFFNDTDRRSLATNAGPTPCYMAEPHDASELLPLTPLSDWQSCVCLPLGYQDDLIGLLVLVSGKKNAFTNRLLGEIVPLRSIATVALAQQLYRAARGRGPAPAPAPEDESTARLKKELELLDQHSSKLDQENRAKAAAIEALAGQIDLLDKSSGAYKQELERVKSAVMALEEQSESATEHLAAAYAQLNETQWELMELERTVEFMKGVFQVLGEGHDSATFAQDMMVWLCDRFEIERCSLMVLDASREALQMAAQCGIDPAIAGRVKVRVGQGVAGWVARHRKPLFVRLREEADQLPRAPESGYNSDSFIVVPLLYRGRLHGVLSLSNKRDGEPFNQTDLERATLAGAALATAFASHEVVRRTASWA